MWVEVTPQTALRGRLQSVDVYMGDVFLCDLERRVIVFSWERRGKYHNSCRRQAVALWAMKHEL